MSKAKVTGPLMNLEIDPAYKAIDFMDTPLCRDVFNSKYAWQDEGFEDMCNRVSTAIMLKDGEDHFQSCQKAMRNQLWMPAGRILAGAGTPKRVTLLNCFVNSTIEDNMESIVDGLGNIMLTQQQGGGIGTDFSLIRPDGAILKRTGSTASGPADFIDVWDAACATIRSAGDRRGAMMGTLVCTHPFLPGFIEAKHTKGRWTNFNVSILVTDAFMGAIEEDEDWYLYHECEPAYTRDPEIVALDFEDDDTGVKQFVYSVHKARELWDTLIQSTYVYAEPGVIFIDRVNDLNNLQYCETIACTNPCVTGDTMILTDQGHLPIKWLVGKETNIWNGEQWSKVEPYSTGVNSLMALTFSNGQTVRCTPYHKWVLADGRRVEAKDLKVTDKLLHAEMPTIYEGGADFVVDAYSQGFYCGDGTKNSTQSNLYKHEKNIRDRLVGKFWDRNCVAQPGHRWLHGEMLPKDFAPVTGTRDFCVNWLAGLLDADGCVSKKHSGNVLEISAKDRKFLQRVGLMLNRLGVNYRMWEGKDAGLKNGSNGKTYMCESTARLMISWKGAHHLVTQGLKTERVDLSSFQIAPKGIANVGHRIVGIQHLQEQEETFCLTEPHRNAFIANGVLTGNCGEQPLPPHGCCDLGAVNLSRMVIKPFTEDAHFNWDLLTQVVHIGVRFLDNVIDVTNYPLPQQREEEINKRRIGLGVSGLADCMHMLGMRYGGAPSVRFTEHVMVQIANAAYTASARLAQEKSPFPFYNADKFLERPFPQTLDPKVQKLLQEVGIRNGVLLTIAPTGTTSIAYGNGSSGLEPVFAHSLRRKVRQANGDDNWLEYDEVAYGARLWLALNPGKCLDDLPAYMNECADVRIHEHIRIQEVCQRWVDASISKTINVPEDIDYDTFKDVYHQAYESGCKGCTTYRPSDIRGSILSTPSAKSDSYEGSDGQDEHEHEHLTLDGRASHILRDEIIDARTIKVHWPQLASALYVTIGYIDGKPYEVFLNSKDQKSLEWTMALTILMSKSLRMGIPLEEICDEFQQISALEGGWASNAEGKGQYWPSLIAYLGYKIRQLETPAYPKILPPTEELIIKAKIVFAEEKEKIQDKPKMAQCPKCREYTVTNLVGCLTCQACGWSRCS